MLKKLMPRYLSKKLLTSSSSNQFKTCVLLWTVIMKVYKKFRLIGCLKRTRLYLRGRLTKRSISIHKRWSRGHWSILLNCKELHDCQQLIIIYKNQNYKLYLLRLPSSHKCQEPDQSTSGLNPSYLYNHTKSSKL